MPYVESQGTLPSRSALTENEERSTMGRCCAAGGVRAGWGKLKHGGGGGDLQQLLVENGPDVFETLAGAWGRQGCTRVQLAPVAAALVEQGLAAAWHRRAPPAVRRRHPEVGGD